MLTVSRNMGQSRNGSKSRLCSGSTPSKGVAGFRAGGGARGRAVHQGLRRSPRGQSDRLDPRLRPQPLGYPSGVSRGATCRSGRSRTGCPGLSHGMGLSERIWPYYGTSVFAPSTDDGVSAPACSGLLFTGLGRRAVGRWIWRRTAAMWPPVVSMPDKDGSWEPSIGSGTSESRTSPVMPGSCGTSICDV